MRRGQGTDEGAEEGCTRACSCIIRGVLFTVYCLSGCTFVKILLCFSPFFHFGVIHPCFNYPNNHHLSEGIDRIYYTCIPVTY